MEAVFTVLGYLCCIFITGWMVSTLANLSRNLINEYCFKDDEYTIQEYKEEIDTILSETKKSGYKIMFRDIHCQAYENCAIHIAKQGDEDIIVIDLF